MKKRFLALLAMIMLVTLAFPVASPVASPLAMASEMETGTVLPGVTTLSAVSTPVLETSKEISPNPVELNSEAEITLEVIGAGDPWSGRQPLDVMLILDRSGSVSGCKLAQAKSAAIHLVGLLDPAQDRIGVVSFNTCATLNQELTNDFDDVEDAINAITANGYTNVGSGIARATSELEDEGRDEAVKVEIMISDGGPNRPSGTDSSFNEVDAQYARDEAKTAYDNGFTLYTVALTEVELQQEFLDDSPAEDHSVYDHDGLAYVGGGTYYDTASEANMDDLYDEIAYATSYVAGRDAVVTEVLPAGVNYVAGSASPSPSSVDGQTITWDLGTIDIGETETITFSVTFDSTGYQLADVYPDTRVTYTNYEGSSTNTPFPETYVTVITAGEVPVADFTADPTSGQAPLTVQFTDTSSGSPTSWAWDFGDGGTSSDQNPSHVYTANGSYTVTLTATNAYGSDDETKSLFINVGVPVADFTADPTSGQAPLTVQFTDTSSGSPTSWAWDFGDGGSSTDQNPSHEYTANGSYTVTLTATNAYGSDDETKTMFINVGVPVANFTANPTSGQAPLTVQFTDTSSGSPTSWAWDFGDGGSSTDQNPSHEYTANGSYTVTLTATNAYGSDDETKTIFINVGPPIANASSNSPVYVGDTIELYGGPDGMDSYSWTGPDGFTSTEQNPTIPSATPDMDGDYTLTVTNLYGSDDATTTVIVYPAEPPTATASSNSPVYVGNTIALYGGPDGMDSYSWTGPDGFTSTEQNPTIPSATLDMDGDYTLTVTNPYGSDDATTYVDVKNKSGGGGAVLGASSLTLTIDFLGRISEGRIGYTGWLYDNINAPSPDDMHMLELQEDIRITGEDEEVVTLITISETSCPGLPENTELVGQAYDFSPATLFSEPIRLTLGYDVNNLPERTSSVYLAYYSPETGWEKITSEPDIVAELGKLSAPVEHFSIYAILADIESMAPSSPDPEPLEPHFIAKDLNITPGEIKGDGTITITATILNDGQESGTYTVILRINGKTTDSQDVTLEPSESQVVSFTLSGMEPGEYSVDVSQLLGEFNVLKPTNWWIIAGIIAAILALGGALFWLFGSFIPAKKREEEGAES